MPVERAIAMCRDASLVGDRPVPVSCPNAIVCAWFVSLSAKHCAASPSPSLGGARLRLPAAASSVHQVLVDGAHALGQIRIDLQAMGNPEYYLSNGHKWFFTPKSAVRSFVQRRHDGSSLYY